MLDPSEGGIPAQNDADRRMVGLRRHRGEHDIGPGLCFVALELPNGRVHGARVEVGDDPGGQSRTLLRIEAGLIAVRRELRGRRRDEELNDPAPARARRPLRDHGQPLNLGLLHCLVVEWIEADEKLEEVGVEGLDVLGERVTELQLEHSRAALFDRHQQDDPVRFGRSSHLGAQVLVDEHALPAGGHASGHVAQPLVDERLRLAHPHQVARRPLTGDAEHVFGERGPMIHRQNEERLVSRRHPAVVRRGHGGPPGVTPGFPGRPSDRMC